jgi:hypothetical protein
VRRVDNRVDRWAVDGAGADRRGDGAVHRLAERIGHDAVASVYGQLR